LVKDNPLLQDLSTQQKEILRQGIHKLCNDKKLGARASRGHEAGPSKKMKGSEKPRASKKIAKGQLPPSKAMIGTDTDESPHSSLLLPRWYPPFFFVHINHPPSYDHSLLHLPYITLMAHCVSFLVFYIESPRKQYHISSLKGNVVHTCTTFPFMEEEFQPYAAVCTTFIEYKCY
jgi:hypothetical protein